MLQQVSGGADRRHTGDRNAAHQGPGWVTQVKEEILRRCSDSNILHIAVDTQSEEGTVYIKTAAMEDAGKVFRWVVDRRP